MPVYCHDKFAGCMLTAVTHVKLSHGIRGTEYSIMRCQPLTPATAFHGQSTHYFTGMQVQQQPATSVHK